METKNAEVALGDYLVANLGCRILEVADHEIPKTRDGRLLYLRLEFADPLSLGQIWAIGNQIQYYFPHKMSKLRVPNAGFELYVYDMDLENLFLGLVESENVLGIHMF